MSVDLFARSVLRAAQSLRLIQTQAWGKRQACVRFALAAVLAATSFPYAASAQTEQAAVSIYEDYADNIKRGSSVAPLDLNSAFGDQTDLNSGSTSFYVTAASIPGNNALEVAVRYKLTPSKFGRSLGWQWESDTAYLEGEFSANFGWVVGSASNPSNLRCSTPGLYPGPPEVPNTAGKPGTFFPEEYWSGNKLVLPGGETALMNTVLASLPNQPTAGGPFKWATNSGWFFSCIPLQSGAGEGFLGHAPDGSKYYFDSLVVTGNQIDALKKRNYLGPTLLDRRIIRIYLTKVVDRFGNQVNYTGTGITASDGRTLSVSGTTISDGIRQWNVSQQPGLFTITNPDGSTWKLERTGGFTESPISGSSCAETQVLRYSGSARISVTLPSAARADFDFEPRLRGFSYVPYECHSPDDISGSMLAAEPPSSAGTQSSQATGPIITPMAGGPYWYLQTPNVISEVALTRKTVSGPGLTTYTASTDYGALNHCYAYGNTSGLCTAQSPTTRTTTVTLSNNTYKRYVFGNKFMENQGHLLRVEEGDVSYPPTRTTSNTYAVYAGVGEILAGGTDGYSLDSFMRSVLTSSTIAQEGATFAKTSGGFDAFLRPTTQTRGSSLGSSVTESIAYHDNTAKWVLGQVKSITCTAPADCSGTVATQTDYDPGSDLPKSIYAFGKLQTSLTYNADGTAATVKDGNNNVTTLSSWKRGIPQAIGNADGTGRSAVVDDRGWITSVTDENGSTTSYRYDLMGRIDLITYPLYDSVSWNATAQSFQQVMSAEYGIGAGHWRQTVSTGNARKEVYFDALWRPLLTREYDVQQLAATERFQRFAYDNEGRATFASYPGATDALSTGTWTDYDVIGRTRAISVDSEQGLLSTTTQYLANFETLTTNPQGHATRARYQAFDKPEYDAPTWIQHPEGAFTDIVRDVFGKPRSIVRRNADGSQAVTRSYVYDVNQQLCKTIEPEVGATANGYDGAGNLLWTASGLALPSATSCDTSAAYGSGRRADRTYDARNRVKTLAFPDGNGNQTWSYYSDGKPSQIVTLNDGSSQVINSYAYNKRGLLTSETTGQPSWYTWTLGYGYDANGALSSNTYPSGLLVDYAPNALGQPSRAGSYASGVSYFPNGGMKQFTYGNGILHTMTQNARQLPSQVTDGTVLNDTYAYDKNGNVSQITDAVTPAYTRAMVYDGLDRLTQATSSRFGGDGIYRYTYDTLDNIRSAKLAGVKEHNYFYDGSNRLTNVQNNAGATIIGIDYDLQGNLRNRNGKYHSFDYGNRLRAVADVEGYRYDGHGRRALAWSPNGGNILSMYGLDGALRRQNNEREGKNYEYIQLNGSLVARLTTIVAPGVPALTLPTFSNNGNYTVSWSAVANTTSYELQEQVNGGGWGGIPTSGQSWSATGKGEALYGYRIRACQASACGSWSATSNISVQLPPTAISSISVPALAASGNYTVSWTTVARANSYLLEQSFNSGAWTPMQNSIVTSATYTNKPAGTYAYRVTGCNAAGCGPASTTATTLAVYPPGSAPSLSVPASSYTGGYTVSWSAVSGAASYQLEEQVNGGAWLAIPSSGTSIAIGGKGAASYSYRVTACNAAGCGPVSAIATLVVTLPPGSAPSVSAPASNGTGAYNVSWSGISAATSYQLDEQVNGGGWVNIQTSAATSKAITGKGTASYGYRVRACNLAGCGPYSAVATVAVTLPPSMAPTMYLPGLAYPGEQYTVEWTAVAGATSYQLESWADAGFWWNVQSGAGLMWTSPGQGAGLYRYRVRACNSAGCGPYAADQVIEVMDICGMPPCDGGDPPVLRQEEPQGGDQ